MHIILTDTQVKSQEKIVRGELRVWSMYYQFQQLIIMIIIKNYSGNMCLLCQHIYNPNIESYNE